MNSGFPSTRLALVLLFINPVMFSANMLSARATIEIIPPVALAFWRWALAFILVMLVVRGGLWRERAKLAAEWRDLLVLGALGMGVCGAFVYVGAHTTTATNIGLIYAASPVLIVLLGHFLYDEHMGPAQILGVVLCVAGVLIIITRADFDTLRRLAFTSGDLWIACASAAWGVYSVMIRHRPSALDLNTRFAGIILGGVLIMAPFTLAEAIYDRPAPLNWTTIGFVVLLAVVPSFGAYQVYSLIQRRLGAARAGLVLYLVPVYNAFLAGALLGERVERYHLIGAALVLPGIWLANLKRS